MKDIRKTINGIIIFGALMAGIDMAVGMIGEWMVRKQPDFGGNITKDNYRMNRLVGDIVFVGSSRTAHHYAIPVLQDSLDLVCTTPHTAFNAGRGGLFFDNTCCVIESLLERCTPSLIVMEATDESWTTEIIQTLNLCRWSYKSNKVYREYVERQGWKEQLLCHINMYRFNGSFYKFLSNILKPGQEYDGYEPLTGEMKVMPEEKDTALADVTISDYSLENFHRVLSKCRDKGCKIVVAASPRFGHKAENERTAAVCAEYGVPYIDMESDAYFNENPQLFRDAGHLNDNGARIYTSMFFTQLKPYLDF